MTNPLATQIGGDHYRHYTLQPIEFIERYDLTFMEGSIFKYLVRHKDKGGRTDIMKALHYAHMHRVKHARSAASLSGVVQLFIRRRSRRSAQFKHDVQGFNLAEPVLTELVAFLQRPQDDKTNQTFICTLEKAVASYARD